MATHPSSGVVSLFDNDALIGTVGELVARYGFAAVRAEVDMHRPPESHPSAPARSTDPETSHAAAKAERDVGRFSERSRQARLLRVFSAGPRTDAQATIRVVGAAAPPSAWDGCRRRCSDLRAAGYLSDSGKRARNVGSNEDAIVWQITYAGRAAIDSLDATGWSR